MIPFDEIDRRLEALGKDRAWLAQASGRSASSIRSALAPGAHPKQRSELLQRALSDAIEREEERQSQKSGLSSPVIAGLYEVRQTPEQAELTDLASRAVNATSLADFCLQAILHRANEIIRHRTDPVTGISLAPLPVPSSKETVDSIVAFPEIPLLHSAAGTPITADGETYAPTREVGAGRFAVQLHGDSMAPRYPDGSIVILRERESLKKPVLKKGQIYLFTVDGENTLKVYQTRVATPDEIEAGLSYVSPRDGKTKVPVLRSLNPAYPEIVVKEPIEWLGYLDPKDNHP